MTNDRPWLARLNWYWIFQLAGWNFLPLLLFSMSPADSHTWRVVAISFWGVAAGLVISDLWHRLLKSQIRNGIRVNWKMMLVAILLLGAIHTGVQTVGYLVIKPFGEVHGVLWLPGALLFWWGVYLVWNIFYMAVLSLRRANRFEQEALRLEISAKEAELRALQAQVNPHFFFNSMNSVRALIYEDQNAAAQMIDQLASVMRYALQSGQNDTVPLAAEIEAVLPTWRSRKSASRNACASAWKSAWDWSRCAFRRWPCRRWWKTPSSTGSRPVRPAAKSASARNAWMTA
jgi:hypothetical protein